MTQSNELLPDKIYVRAVTDKTLSAVRPESPIAQAEWSGRLKRTEYVRADLTPPQSPNRAVLDDEIVTYDNFKTVTSRRMMALVELFSGFPDCQAEKRAWEHLLIYAPKTITYAATQADEVKVIPDVIIRALQDYRDEHCFDDSEYGIAIDAFLKRQKGR